MHWTLAVLIFILIGALLWSAVCVYKDLKDEPKYEKMTPARDWEDEQ